MASFYPIKDLINSAIALDVANPNLAISEKETLLKEAAITLGTLDYYRCFPMRSVPDHFGRMVHPGQQIGTLTEEVQRLTQTG
mgnify:CR=1 FL=1